jgi:general secretion pathway protein G
VAANRIRWGIGALVLSVAIVASIVLLRGQLVDTKEMDARARLKTLHQALGLYKEQHSVYPTTEQSLTVLIDRPGSRGYLTDKQALLDPWGARYIYRTVDAQHGGGFHLYSSGPNGTDDDGRGDDIVEPLSP